MLWTATTRMTIPSRISRDGLLWTLNLTLQIGGTSGNALLDLTSALTRVAKSTHESRFGGKVEPRKFTVLTSALTPANGITPAAHGPIM